MRILPVILTLLFSAASATAQDRQRISFDRGDTGISISATVTGKDFTDYVVTASEGQQMTASLAVTDTNGSGIAYFNILPPGSTGEAIWIGHMELDQTADIDLPSDGDYVLRVYLMGNDADTGKTVDYELRVDIE